MTSPLGANLHAKTAVLPFFFKFREHICNAPLRLSPAEGGEDVGKTVSITVLPTNRTSKQRYLWPSSVAWHVPDSTSHNLRVMSRDADTMVLPWGAKSHA